MRGRVPQSSIATDATLTRYTEASALHASFNNTSQFYLRVT